MLLFYSKEQRFQPKGVYPNEKKVLSLKLEAGIIFIFITGDCQHG